MGRQKSAEAIVVSLTTTRRAEHEMPRVGGGNTWDVDEGRRFTASGCPHGGAGVEPWRGCGGCRGGHDDPPAIERGDGRADGSRGQPRQPLACVRAGEAEQGERRCRWHRHARVQGPPATALADDQGQTAGGGIHAFAGAPGGYHVRWCERTAGATPPPTRLRAGT